MVTEWKTNVLQYWYFLLKSRKNHSYWDEKFLILSPMSKIPACSGSKDLRISCTCVICGIRYSNQFCPCWRLCQSHWITWRSSSFSGLVYRLADGEVRAWQVMITSDVWFECWNLWWCSESDECSSALKRSCHAFRWLSQVQMDVAVWFVQDQLKGDNVTEIRVKFMKRLEDALPAGED